MGSLERNRDADIIVYILTQIQFSGLGCVGLLEGGIHRYHQILKASVAGHGHAAVYLAIRLDREPPVGDPGGHDDVRIKDFGVAERFKELMSGSPLKELRAATQIGQTDYKGLQS